MTNGGIYFIKGAALSNSVIADLTEFVDILTESLDTDEAVVNFYRDLINNAVNKSSDFQDHVDPCKFTFRSNNSQSTEKYILLCGPFAERLCLYI